MFGPDPNRDTTRPSKLIFNFFKVKRKKRVRLPELPVLVFIHGESWSWGSARWITRIVTKPNPIGIGKATNPKRNLIKSSSCQNCDNTKNKKIKLNFSEPQISLLWHWFEEKLVSFSLYDARVLATLGKIIVVTFNYRIGVLGKKPIASIAWFTELCHLRQNLWSGWLNTNPSPNTKGHVANYGLIDQVFTFTFSFTHSHIFHFPHSQPLHCRL